MQEMILKLEQIGKSGSLKQNSLKQLLEQNNVNSPSMNDLMAESQEYSCLLFPDDDED